MMGSFIENGLNADQVKKIVLETIKNNNNNDDTDERKSDNVKRWDVFISHASEDKEAVARPFAEKLKSTGLEVWYDEFNMTWGKSMRASIDEGLINSLFGIVILSKSFFQKEWTKIELDGLTNIMITTGKDNILPLRYEITPEEVSAISPTLAGIFSRSWDEGVDKLVDDVKKLVEVRRSAITPVLSKESNTIIPIKIERTPKIRTNSHLNPAYLFDSENKFSTQREIAILDQIKSKGYWEIEIRPQDYDENRLTKEQCQKLIRDCQIDIRGWDYPPIGDRIEEFFVGRNCVEGIVDFSTRKEIWRLYQSGQFVHFFSIYEDWLENISWRGGGFSLERQSQKKVKEVNMTLYSVTEIFEFIFKLSSKGIYDESLQVTINLHNTNERSLVLGPTSMADLYRDYKCMYEPIVFSKQYLIKDILANSSNLSLDATVEIFSSFNWILKDDSKSSLKTRQTQFLNGQL